MRTALLLLLLTPAGAVAQEASPYLPLSHWSMPFIEHLIAAGRIADPSPLSRPFKVQDVVRALDAVDSNVVTGAEWAVVKHIRSISRAACAGRPRASTSRRPPRQARTRAATRCAQLDRDTRRSPAARG